MGESSGDKSEDPTPHRLREARQKGQIAKSKELTVAALLLASYGVFRMASDMVWAHMSNMVRLIYEFIPFKGDLTIPSAMGILSIGITAFTFAVMPVFLVTFVVALVSEALQSGFVASVDPLMPRLQRISPAEGFKRMFSLQGFIELIKSVLKIVIVVWIAWRAVQGDLALIIILGERSPWQAVIVGGGIAYRIAWRVGLFYVAIAILDYLYRRWEYIRNLRMTKQEVKEEYKRLEGDPLIKQRMREFQRQIAQQRMMGAVPQADVVVTNPTHIAVALQYKVAKMKAPTLLAKGERLVAEEIRRRAEDSYVPIVENEPLARSIYRLTNVGEQVPAELFQAVAEVLAYVYKLKREKAVLRKKTKKQVILPTLAQGRPQSEAANFATPPSL